MKKLFIIALMFVTSGFFFYGCQDKFVEEESPKLSKAQFEVSPENSNIPMILLENMLLTHWNMQMVR